MSTHALSHLWLLPLTLLAFAALMLAMDRHQEDLFGRVLAARTTRLLRCTGWALLAVALIPAIHLQGVGLGLVSWFGHLSLAAWVVYLVLVVVERRHAAEKEKERARRAAALAAKKATGSKTSGKTAKYATE